MPEWMYALYKPIRYAMLDSVCIVTYSSIAGHKNKIKIKWSVNRSGGNMLLQLTCLSFNKAHCFYLWGQIKNRAFSSFFFIRFFSYLKWLVHDIFRKVHVFNIHLYLKIVWVVCIISVDADSQKICVLWISCKIFFSANNVLGIQWMSTSTSFIYWVRGRDTKVIE